MGQSSSDNESTNGVTDEADFADARNGTEREDVLLYFVCEAFSHFHQVSLSLVLICLGQQNYCVWVLQRYLVLKQSHVVVVALEAVLKDKKMDSDKPCINRSHIFVVSFSDFGLTDLISALDFFDKVRIVVDAVTLFENNGT